MKAYGITENGGVSKLTELSGYAAAGGKPRVGPDSARDLLVRVRGVSVNPVDYKVRERYGVGDDPRGRILGWDAAGVVEEVGPGVASYKAGDEVYYAGDLSRPGSNAEYQLVDERLVGRKPKSLSFAESAGFPLVAITAWEMLFDSLAVPEGGGAGESLLVLGGGGGVGSVAIQLAKAMTGLTVVATASRPDTVEWVKKMGADHVVTHREPLPPQLKALGLAAPKYVLCLNGTEGHVEGIFELIKPRGRIAVIDEPPTLDVAKHPNFMLKSLSLSWELMFTRSMFKTDDMDYQQRLLDRVSAMIDAGTVQSVVTQNLGALDLETLKRAHEIQESGTAIGKNVMEVP
jgi:zinc-binding alcohol dehydrogenase family protein